MHTKLHFAISPKLNKAEKYVSNKILCIIRNIFHMTITIYTLPSVITGSLGVLSIIEVS